MRLGTKVLLLTLTVTLGLSGVVLWAVTSRITARETAAARENIREAMSKYDERLARLHEKIALIVHELISEPVRREYLDRFESEKPDDPRIAAEQFHENFLGKDIPTELGNDPKPSFQSIQNAAGDTRVAVASD